MGAAPVLTRYNEAPVRAAILPGANPRHHGFEAPALDSRGPHKDAVEQPPFRFILGNIPDTDGDRLRLFGLVYWFGKRRVRIAGDGRFAQGKHIAISRNTLNIVMADIGIWRWHLTCVGTLTSSATFGFVFGGKRVGIASAGGSQHDERDSTRGRCDGPPAGAMVF